MENKGSNNKKNNNDNNGITILIFVLAALVVLFIASIINNSITKMTNQEIAYSTFKNMVKEGKVESVEFSSGRISIVPKTQDGKISIVTYNTTQLNDETLIPMLDENNVQYKATQASTASAILYNILSIAIPVVILWIAMGFLLKRMGGGGGVMGVGKSNAKIYVEKQTGVTFLDVAGQGEAKESLQEVVDFLHNPKKYTEIGAKLPKGALLVGPPGTGKTLLAKAVAGEAKVPFFSLAGSDFVEMFVGVGASRVRDLFKEAQKQAPCIIFIDEIDAIGKSRDTRYGGNDEREQTLNQLLAEMDGFDSSKGVLILAATNRPEILDKALLRPGRFDRRIIVDKPDLKGRKETLKVHAKHVLMDDSVDLDAIALATSGAVGSDLANMINEAAINAVKSGRKYVNQADLFESVEVVIAGKEKKDRIMGPKEKKMVAFHEVGHALVTALQKDTEPVQKITIVPRTMGALGYTMQVPEEEKFLMTKNELVAHLVTYMGGRAAEEIAFDSVTTGASNDIEQATKIARAMVTQYGMSEKFGLMGLVTVESQYLDGRASLNCGEETAAQIDKEVMIILQESYAKAKELLGENRSVLDEISEYLYEHETITGKEFMEIFRKLKGIPEPKEEGEEETKKHESHINAKKAYVEKEQAKGAKKKAESKMALPGIQQAEPEAVLKAGEALGEESSQLSPGSEPEGAIQAERGLGSEEGSQAPLDSEPEGTIQAEEELGSEEGSQVQPETGAEKDVKQELGAKEEIQVKPEAVEDTQAGSGEGIQVNPEIIPEEGSSVVQMTEPEPKLQWNLSEEAIPLMNAYPMEESEADSPETQIIADRKPEQAIVEGVSTTEPDEVQIIVNTMADIDIAEHMVAKDAIDSTAGTDTIGIIDDIEEPFIINTMEEDPILFSTDENIRKETPEPLAAPEKPLPTETAEIPLERTTLPEKAETLAEEVKEPKPSSRPVTAIEMLRKLKEESAQNEKPEE